VNTRKVGVAAGVALLCMSLATAVAGPLVARAGWTPGSTCGLTPQAPPAGRGDCTLLVRARYLGSPVMKQDMPLDCESAALAVALQIRHIDLSQNWVFAQLPKDTRTAVLSHGVPVVWDDPYSDFVGNVDGSEPRYTGYGVYDPPIAAVAERAGAKAVGATGWTTTEIESQVGAGNPVVIWVNFNFGASGTRTWQARDGRTVPYTTEEHAVTVIGYDSGAGTVTVMDVGVGLVRTLTTAAFTAALTTFGGMAVAIS
jgi:uncharacterized protein YvpB